MMVFECEGWCYRVERSEGKMNDGMVYCRQRVYD